MDWNTIQEELRRLTTLVDGWSQRNEIPAVERDLALEKLRNLYETVRFAESGRAEMPAETDPEAELLPESLDLGAVLSLDGFPDPDEPAGPVSADPAVPPIVPAAPVFPAAEPLDEAPLAAEPIIAEPEVVPVAEPEPVPAEPVAAPESAPIPEPVSAGPVAGSEPASEPVAEPAPESAAESPAAEGAAPEKPRPHAAPTLFGLEDEAVVRHRHKQRVIMSLYDPNPTVETIPAAPRHSDAQTVPHGGPTPMPGSSQPRVVPSSAVSQTPDPLAGAPIPEPPIFESTTSAAPESAEGCNADPAAPTSGIPELPTPAAAMESIPDAASAFRMPAADGAGNGLPTLQGGTVLGEVINHDVQTLADTLARPHDVASELRRSEPVTDLRKALGLNDRFLLIRDLFGGDGEACERALDTLNGFEDLDDCMIFIAEHYAWNPNSDGAKLLMELLERKFA